VSEAAVGEVASVCTAHDVVAGAGADEVGPVPGVDAVAPGERANLVTAVGTPEQSSPGVPLIVAAAATAASAGFVSARLAMRKPSVRTSRVDADAMRGRALVEESREAVVVLDADDHVVHASRRARQTYEGIREGRPLPPALLTGEQGVIPYVVPYEVDGRVERLVYLSREGDLAAYEELRSGFTAAVSHELRTPLARLLTLLETAALPGEDVRELLERAEKEVEQITELIDEVLFLSELESGARVVSLGPMPVKPSLEEAMAELRERAERADVVLRLECDDEIELAVRPRMLRVVARNLAENAIRYAGPGSTFTLGVTREPDGSVVVSGKDDGVGIDEAELPRLFERFYRADQARASRGTGLGLAIVKHVVVQAGGAVEARGGRGLGVEIRCSFPAQ
jgi:signal transduction histidine kinase